MFFPMPADQCTDRLAAAGYHLIELPAVETGAGQPGEGVRSGRRRREMPQLTLISRRVGIMTAPSGFNTRLAAIAAWVEAKVKSR